AVRNETDGLGIIHDSSRYKPLRLGQNGGFHEKNGDRGKDHREWGERGLRGYEQAGRPERHFKGENGGFGGPRSMGGVRVMNSDIRNEDIITGTENKVMQTFRRGQERFAPHFVLLCCAPSASMINSDLEYAAEKISGLSGLPAAEVKIAGERDYLYGIGMTLEAIGKLLLTAQKTIPGTINILGANTIDWGKETLLSAERLFTDAGWQVISRWGVRETTENLKRAAAARVNVAVSEAGLRLARYMESEFGIPYVAGAPFGEEAAKDLLGGALSAYQAQDGSGKTESGKAKFGGTEAGNAESCRAVSSGGNCLKSEVPESEREKAVSPEQIAEAPEILIAAEQFIANAVRQTLFFHGLRSIRVLSFYDMDRACMLQGDKKLACEDDFAAEANAASVRMIIADPDYQPLVKKEAAYIGFPNGGSFSPVSPTENFDMTGERLDRWLREKGCF
ncbi:MAG: hypothetical protein LUC90_11950, partial [Lachnospiraceae bacterium]|nr:hypothetical protein [Lachnospiraceae bacterium]